MRSRGRIACSGVQNVSSVTLRRASKANARLRLKETKPLPDILGGSSGRLAVSALAGLAAAASTALVGLQRGYEGEACTRVVRCGWGQNWKRSDHFRRSGPRRCPSRGWEPSSWILQILRSTGGQLSFTIVRLHPAVRSGVVGAVERESARRRWNPSALAETLSSSDTVASGSRS